MNFDRILNQKVVYWAPGSLDNYGNTSWAGGAEIAGRWEEGSFLFLNTEGESEVASDRVYMDGANTLELDGRLYLGELDDLTSGQQADPTTVSSAKRIVKVGKAPRLRGSQKLAQVLLK
jgi:hypothetical protein